MSFGLPYHPWVSKRNTRETPSRLISHPSSTSVTCRSLPNLSTSCRCPKGRRALYLLECAKFYLRIGEHMKSKIVVFGFVLVSVFAVAQSSNKTVSANKSNDTKQAPAAAAGQASVKMTPEKVEAGSESLKTASEVSTGKATGKAKTSASDDWHAHRVAD